MVEYKCKKCFKNFVHKGDFNRHLARKTPCNFKNSIDSKVKFYKCYRCNKKFNRKDNLSRHIKNCKNINLDKKNHRNIKNVSNHGQIINGDISGNNNKFIIKNYNLFPFGKDGIDCLTTPEKIAIFSSDENPMEMIIIKVHLDPLKLDHHNVGYTDEHSGYGIIFDGDQWLTERIDVIMEVLFDSKEKDLLKIHDEIKDILRDDKNDNIKDTLDNLNRKIRPTNKIDAASKRNLITHLKKHFYNSRQLVLDAKKNTDKNNIKIKKNINYDHVLKEGYTLEDADRIIKQKQQKTHRMHVKKQIAKDFLQKMDEISKKDCLLLANSIDQINDINVLNIILRLLYRSYCFGNEFNNEIIENEIKKDAEIDFLLNNTVKYVSA